MSLTGIILAGGRSHRMGKDKGLIRYHGKTLIEQAIGTLAPWCSDLLISANNPVYEQFGLRVVPDSIRDIGPMGGILSGLEASPNNANLILACDIVAVPENLLQLLTKYARNHEAVIPLHPDGKAEPLCAWYHRNICNPMANEAKRGNYKLIDFLRQRDTVFLPLQTSLKDYHPQILRNLNRPEDFFLL
ncbi:MAG: molybdenum cofactor guanylyltransferase [Chlorobi bacterium]|nr:molybdenum cofactor guanylyltransferase [Chlorobiota bacterium]